MSVPSATSGLRGRRVQILGSASQLTDPSLIKYGHQLIAAITREILREGGGLLLNVGKEPRPAGASTDFPSLIFDWTALETAVETIRGGLSSWSSISGPPILIVTSEKAQAEIPSGRLELWRELLNGGYVNVEFIQPGARSATMIRDRQAQLGDILLAIGGGTGVEHSARLYSERRRPVIPIDLPLGASREDGTGGASKLSAEARNDIGRFFSLRPEFASTAGARFAALATRSGAEEVSGVAERTIELLKLLSPPTVFYTRLVNPTVSSFPRVEQFFREIVDPLVAKIGFRRIEVGTDFTVQPFINVAVFENLHFASVAVVDLTSERPNCYMELGYAFGRGIRVIMTAEEGTILPFDPAAIPCFFWKHGVDDVERRKNFEEFWQKYINRAPLVS